MAKPDKMVFLSYRHESGALADFVEEDLSRHRFNVFMDLKSLASGKFGPHLLRAIEDRMHFLVLLEPRSLDGIGLDGDWLRREIAHALSHSRNIVPLLVNGARMPAAVDLPADIADFCRYNALVIPRGDVTGAMSRLREEYLRPQVHQAAATPSARPSATSIFNGWIGRAPEHRRLRAPTARICNGVLSWTVVPDAISYIVQVDSLDCDFALPAVVYCGTGREYPIEPRAAECTCWFRVKGFGPGIDDDMWSRPVKFWSPGR